MTTVPLVSIIIVNWNGKDVLGDCLRSLAKLHYPNWELILVDNGSADGSEKLTNLVSKQAKRIKLIINKENVGFAKANNQGYVGARGKYVLLLNNDTQVNEDLLSLLVKRISKDPKIGVIQPKVRLMAKPSHLDTVGSYLTITGFLQHWGYLQKDSDEFSRETLIFSAKGACMLIRREVIEKVGLFDDDFGSYFEETDFCWRVFLAGYIIIYYPDAEILHKVGYSSKRQDQIFVNYNAFKNRIASLLKNLELVSLLIFVPIHLAIILGLAVYYLITGQFNKSRMIVESIGWNIINLKSIWRKRYTIRKFRVVKDNDLLPQVMRPIDWGKMLLHFARSERMLEGKHEV